MKKIEGIPQSIIDLFERRMKRCAVCMQRKAKTLLLIIEPSAVGFEVPVTPLNLCRVCDGACASVALRTYYREKLLRVAYWMLRSAGWKLSDADQEFMVRWVGLYNWKKNRNFKNAHQWSLGLPPTRSAPSDYQNTAPVASK